ncbi:MAG: phosphoglycerate dehydrogenase [Bacteroidetes bacterium]|nr:phosphoglycerate dehydrogenase [Bacteroidota bacterium]
MKKILISDSIDLKCKEILEDAGIEVTYLPEILPGEIKKNIGGFNGLIVRSRTQANDSLLESAINLNIIGRAGTGCDNIDITTATRKGILVMNTPGGNTISAAEHTLALMLSLCRNVPQANASMLAGKWERGKFKGTELSDKTLGIIGLGKIGKEVALRAIPFGMKVICYDPLMSEESASKLDVELVSLDELYKHSDIITIHVPLTKETNNIISEETLNKCKKGVKIINCARGGLIDEAALLKYIENGHVSGAAIDVYKTEPPNFENPLFKHPNVITTPHLGASTKEAQQKVAVQIANQIADYFNGKEIKGAVNGIGIEAINNKDILPFVTLSEKIGKIYSQLSKNRLKQIDINYCGETLHKYSQFLSICVLKGFLNDKLEENVNLINAPFLAKENGIIINEIKSSSDIDYKNLLSITFHSKGELRKFDGTVFGKKEIRIVGVNNYRIEVNPEGYLLFYTNEDKPGMLAIVSKLLAENNINIGGLSLGRRDKGDEAFTVINIDNNVDKNILEKIKSYKGISNVGFIKL